MTRGPPPNCHLGLPLQWRGWGNKRLRNLANRTCKRAVFVSRHCTRAGVFWERLLRQTDLANWHRAANRDIYCSKKFICSFGEHPVDFIVKENRTSFPLFLCTHRTFFFPEVGHVGGGRRVRLREMFSSYPCRDQNIPSPALWCSYLWNGKQNQGRNLAPEAGSSEPS